MAHARLLPLVALLLACAGCASLPPGNQLIPQPLDIKDAKTDGSQYWLADACPPPVDLEQQAVVDKCFAEASDNIAKYQQLYLTQAIKRNRDDFDVGDLATGGGILAALGIASHSNAARNIGVLLAGTGLVAKTRFAVDSQSAAYLHAYQAMSCVAKEINDLPDESEITAALKALAPAAAQDSGQADYLAKAGIYNRKRYKVINQAARNINNALIAGLLGMGSPFVSASQLKSAYASLYESQGSADQEVDQVLPAAIAATPAGKQAAPKAKSVPAIDPVLYQQYRKALVKLAMFKKSVDTCAAMVSANH